MKGGSQPFVGKLTETKLKIRKRVPYRNDLQTVLDATLLPTVDGSHTLIDGHIGLIASTIFFNLLWFSGAMLGVIILSIPSALKYLSTYPNPQEDGILIGILVPLCLLVFGVLTGVLGRWLARHEEAKLMDMMQHAIQAIPNTDNNAV